MSSSFDLEVARRLPLADAALRLLEHVLDDDFLQGVFDRHRGRSYQRKIAFPLFVNLIADALLGHRGASAHQTFQKAKEDESLDATIQAMYDKLKTVPIQLSAGLFSEATARLQAVASSTVANPLPKSVADFRVLGFDGKKLKYVANRLKPLRGLKGNIYGGKLLVVQDLATQQAIAAEAAADGETADNPLVPPVVERVRALSDGQAHLWIGDRAFCDFKLLGLLSVNPDQFVVRFNTACGFHCDESEPMRIGEDDAERPYREEWGWLGKPNNPHRIRVRRITITSAQKDPLIFVTSLQDADLYPAAELLTLYRSRWEIETMFQQVVQTFDLRHLISGTPRATVFQAMLCLLLYNITLMIRNFVADGADREPDTISLNLLFGDLVRELTGWMKVITTDRSLELLRATRILNPEDLRSHLQKTLGCVWTDCWAKSPTRKRPQKAPPRAYICGGHTSVDKILRGAHYEIPLKPNKEKTAAEKQLPRPHLRKKKDL